MRHDSAGHQAKDRLLEIDAETRMRSERRRGELELTPRANRCRIEVGARFNARRVTR